MPWQDVQIAVEGEAAKDVALNFIQRFVPFSLFSVFLVFLSISLSFSKLTFFFTKEKSKRKETIKENKKKAQPNKRNEVKKKIYSTFFIYVEI